MRLSCAIKSVVPPQPQFKSPLLKPNGARTALFACSGRCCQCKNADRAVGAPLVLHVGFGQQTLEMRRFQVEELCRQLGVNPILVYAESKNTTYASAEQMFLAIWRDVLVGAGAPTWPSSFSFLRLDNRSRKKVAVFLASTPLLGVLVNEWATRHVTAVDWDPRIARPS